MTKSSVGRLPWAAAIVTVVAGLAIYAGPPARADSPVVSKVSFGGIPHYAVVTLATRPGATQSFLLMEADDAKASVILFAGGNGVLGLNPLGLGTNLQGNFLVRTRDLYTAERIRIAIVDVPSDAGTFPNFRLTAEHAQDMEAVISYLRHRYHDPVWLVGTSAGTVSVANVASRLSGSDSPDGIVLTASSLLGGGGTVFNSNLAAITVPTLVVHHELDACPVTLFADVPALMAALSGASDLQLLSYTGGGPPVGNVCDGFYWHGFIGIEAQVVDDIAGYIFAHHPHGHHGHDH